MDLAATPARRFWRRLLRQILLCLTPQRARPVLTFGLEQESERAPAVRQREKEPLGQRRERRPGQPKRPLAVLLECPQAGQKAGGTDPDFARVADDHQLVT